MKNYLEVVITTAEGIGEGFMRGYFRGAGDSSEIINLERRGLEHETFKGFLEEMIHPGEEILHLLIEEEKYGLLKEALKKLTDEGFGGVEKVKKSYKKISAKFNLKTYARKTGAEAKKLLTAKRGDVLISFDEKPEESISENADGVELYAPDHPYELKANGKIEGSIEEILPLLEKLGSLGVEFSKVKMD